MEGVKITNFLIFFEAQMIGKRLIIWQFEIWCFDKGASEAFMKRFEVEEKNL